MTDINIINLPDEVKVKIFEYLDGVSKSELAKVCVDFSRVCQDRKIMEHLNFAANYKVCLNHFKFRVTPPIYKYVTYLNVSSVYWIPSAQMRYALIKFTELIYLNVTDTQMNFRDLKTVLSVAPKISRLALSLKNDHCSDVMFLKLEHDITHFFVQYNSYSLRALFNMLSNFENLDELWMIETKLPDGYQVIPEFPWAAYAVGPVPKVKNKFVFTKQGYMLKDAEDFIKAIKVEGNWLEMLKYSAPIYLWTENLSSDSCLKTHDIHNVFEEKLLYLLKEVGCENMFSVWDMREMMMKKMSFSQFEFEYINLTKENNRFGDRVWEIESHPDIDKLREALTAILFSKNMQKLKSLKMGWLYIYNKKANVESPYLPLFKKPRIGTASSTVNDACLFARITNHLKYIEELEIVKDYDVPRSSVKWEWQPNCLKFITNFVMLKKLVLTSVPFTNGKFLIEVTQKCPYLKILKINDVAVQDKISYDVCSALQFAKNLQDFRFERAGSAPIDDLFEAITRCPNIQRVYLQCKSTKSISKKPLETLLSTCEKLIFFMIYITDLIEAVCKTIKQSMVHFDIKPIQIFTIKGRGYSLNNISYDDIPSIHIRDIVCQTTDMVHCLDTF